MNLGLDGQVVIVTGAGRGLGRAYALDLARHGAKVVVNDIGVDKAGHGPDASIADQVVAEIRDAGGEALSNRDSVATYDGAHQIVKGAVDQWGHVEAIVSNAGFLRDGAFHNMSEADWDDIFSVHAKGAFNILRAAWPLFRQQQYGRIVLATSSAGFVGNFGQASYGAAKGALVGLMNVLKIEGDRHNIKVNCIAPIAGTRMTEGLFRDDQFESLAPELASPAVTYLCSPACTTTGAIIEAGGGSFNRAAIVRNRKARVSNRPITVEDVVEKWPEIMDLDGAEAWWDLGTRMSKRNASI